MKKTLAIILALILAISLFAGCSTQTENKEEENNTKVST